MEELRRIRAALAAGITKKEMAKRAKVARRILDALDTPAFNPTMRTLLKLSAAAEALVKERMAALKKAS